MFLATVRASSKRELTHAVFQLQDALRGTWDLPFEPLTGALTSSSPSEERAPDSLALPIIAPAQVANPPAA